MHNITATAESVTTDELITLTKGVYGVELHFNFIGDEWDGLIKKAVFNGKETAINDNVCIIPEETTAETGNIELGVYGYKLENDELKLRLSPYPSVMCVINGSFDKAISEAQAATPTEYEKQVANMQAIIDSGKTELKTIIDSAYNELEQIIDDSGVLE